MFVLEEEMGVTENNVLEDRGMRVKESFKEDRDKKKST